NGERYLEDISIEKEQCRQRLILGGSTNAGLDGEARQEDVDLLLAHLARMPLAVKKDEAANPSHVGLFGAAAGVHGAQREAHTAEQAGLLALDRNRNCDRDDVGH